MKEQFDKKLIEKIKISFEDHEEPFNPQEWEKLSHAYFRPGTKRKFIYWPFLVSGIAASLLLLIIFWPMGEDLQKNVQTIADSITFKGKQFEKIELPLESEKKQLAEAKKPERLYQEEDTGAEPNSDDFRGGSQRTIGLGPIIMAGQPHPALNAIVTPLERARKTREDIQKNAANGKIGSTIIAQKENPEKIQLYLEQWKAEGQSAHLVAGEKNTDNNVRLGILVGPQTSSNPVSGMSLGAGVVSEFSFSKRLKLDVGITYGRHSLVADNSLPRNEMMNSPQSNEAFQSLSSSPRYIGSNAELNFSGLDIPVNLKYKVVDREKSGLFIITGLSSMVYFDQHTTETMAINSYFSSTMDGDLEFERSVQEFTQESSPENSADGVDLGRMLNLSVGYEYSLNNGTFLSIEPYYKLPLGEMTFANQQFSIGGLNLRMNFRLGK